MTDAYSIPNSKHTRWLSAASDLQRLITRKTSHAIALTTTMNPVDDTIREIIAACSVTQIGQNIVRGNTIIMAGFEPLRRLSNESQHNQIMHTLRAAECSHSNHQMAITRVSRWRKNLTFQASPVFISTPADLDSLSIH